MAVGPFRAVVAAHLQGTVNRTRRQLGRRGLWVVVVVLGLLGLFGVVPWVSGLGVFGYFAGSGLTAGSEQALLVPFFCLLLSGLTLVGGAFGGLTGATRQLPWEFLQGFPVTTRALFAAELVAGASEVVTVIELLILLALCAGASAAQPVATPVFAVLFVCSALGLLSTQLLVGSLAQRLSKQTRLMFLALPAVALVLSSLLPKLAERMSKQSLDSGLELASWVSAALPAGQAVEAARAMIDGHSAHAPRLLAPLVVLTLALVVFAWLAVSRETPLSTLDEGQAARKLWSFTAPVYGVARLQWEALAASIAGRFGLLMPLFTIVLVRGPLAEVMGRGEWVVPASFSYCALASTNLLFNQFGLDRHGVKALFLLPIDEVTLLRGKLLGFVAWQSLQVLMLVALMMLTGHADPLGLLLGLCFYGCFFLILSMVGQFTSLWQPRPMAKGGMRGGQPPLTVVLVTLGTLLVTGSTLFGTLWVLRHFAPRWELPVFAALMLGLAGLTQVVLRLNAVLLKSSREKLVEMLGSGV